MSCNPPNATSLITGFILHERAYLRSFFNWIDFIVAIASIVAYAPYGRRRIERERERELAMGAVFRYPSCLVRLTPPLRVVIPSVKAVRALRALRSLRLLSIFENTRVVLKAFAQVGFRSESERERERVRSDERERQEKVGESVRGRVRERR